MQIFKVQSRVPKAIFVGGLILTLAFILAPFEKVVAQTRIYTPLPNYQISSVGSGSSQLRVGQSTTVRGTVKNNSAQDVTISSFTKLEINGPDSAYQQPITGPTPNVGNLFMPPAQSTGALVAGATETETWQWTPTLPGAYRIRISADTGDTLSETNLIRETTERDNKTDLYVVVVASTVLPPDYRVQEFRSTSQTPFVAGQGISFSGKVRNVGPGAATASSTPRLRIDIGNDGSYDFIVNSQLITQPLGPGASQVHTWGGSAWTAVAGNHKAELCADVGNTVTEFSETNNCSWWVFPVAPLAASCSELYLIAGDQGTWTTLKDVWKMDTSGNWTNVLPSTGGTGRSEFGSVFFNNKIWVSGGTYSVASSTWLPLFTNDLWSLDSQGSVTVFDHDAGISGIQNAPWYGRWGHVMIEYNGKLWVMGGETNGSQGPVPDMVLNDVWSFDGTTWTQFDHNTNLPGIQNAPWTPRTGMAAAVYNNKIILSGGLNSYDDINEVWEFDGTSWSGFDNNTTVSGIQAAPWEGRFEHALVAYDNKLWVMGGEKIIGALNDVWFFDGSFWKRFDHDASAAGIQDAPWDKRHRFTATVFNNKLWVIGGENDYWNNQRDFFNDVWSFDGTMWTPKGNAPWMKRAGHGAVVSKFPCQ